MASEGENVGVAAVVAMAFVLVLSNLFWAIAIANIMPTIKVSAPPIVQEGK